METKLAHSSLCQFDGMSNSALLSRPRDVICANSKQVCQLTGRLLICGRIAL